MLKARQLSHCVLQCENRCNPVTGMCLSSQNNSGQVERSFIHTRNPFIWGLHTFQKTSPETTYKNPVLRDKLQQQEMKLFAQGTRLKQNSRTTPVPVRRALPCKAAHARGSVLILLNLALGEFFKAGITPDRHPPLCLQSLSKDASVCL